MKGESHDWETHMGKPEGAQHAGKHASMIGKRERQ